MEAASNSDLAVVVQEIHQLRQVFELCEKNMWLAQDQATLKTQKAIQALQKEVEELRSQTGVGTSRDSKVAVHRSMSSLSLANGKGPSDLPPVSPATKRSFRARSWGSGSLKKQAEAQLVQSWVHTTPGEETLRHRAEWRGMMRGVKKWRGYVHYVRNREDLRRAIEARVNAQMSLGARRSGCMSITPSESGSDSRDRDLLELILPLAVTFVGMFSGLLGWAIPPTVAVLLAVCAMGELFRALHARFEAATADAQSGKAAKPSPEYESTDSRGLLPVERLSLSNMQERAKWYEGPKARDEGSSASTVTTMGDDMRSRGYSVESVSGMLTSCESLDGTSIKGDRVESVLPGHGADKERYANISRLAVRNIISVSKLEGNWSLMKTTKTGLAIYTRPAAGRDGDQKQVCGKARVAVSPMVMLQEVTDTDNWKSWDPMLRQVDKWEFDGVAEAFPGMPEFMDIQLSLHGIFPVTARDMRYLQTVKKVDGSWVVSSRSIDGELAPERKGYVRAFLHGAGWHIAPVEGKPNECDVTYTLDIDIKMRFIPNAVMNMICVSFPCVIDKVRKKLNVLPE